MAHRHPPTLLNTARLGALLALLVLTACGADDGGASDAYIEEAPRLFVTEELRLGSVDDPDAGFSQISGIAIDDDGLVYVLEGRDLQVRVYDENGNLQRTFGGSGEGPGEFRSARLIGFRHDTLAIDDRSLGRLSLFSREGALLETLFMPTPHLQTVPGVSLMLEPTRFRGDGFVARIWGVLRLSDPPRDSVWVPQVALDRRGQITDTLRLERWSFAAPAQVEVGGRNLRVPGGPPAGPLYLEGRQDLFVVSRPVAGSADSGAFVVTRTTANGDTIYHRAFGYRPIAFNDAAIDDMVAGAVRPFLGNADFDSSAAAAAIRRALRLPAFQPPVSDGRAGADDVLWLRLHDDGSTDQPWILIGATGELIGRLSLPPRAVIHWSNGDDAWANVPDELGVPWLVRFRLLPEGGS